MSTTNLNSFEHRRTAGVADIDPDVAGPVGKEFDPRFSTETARRHA
jgi:hypothetical protein